MNILVSGATGFIGQSLIKALDTGHHDIYALVRKSNKMLPSHIKQLTTQTITNVDTKFDVFINLAGENIAAQPWTKKRKKVLFDSRARLTNEIRSALRHSPKTVVSMSAVGYYGASRADYVDENSSAEPGFSHNLCAAWEDAAIQFQDDNSRVVIFRLGVVLGKGGALQKMRLPYLCGFGGPIADGQQWFSWIHKDDVIKAILNAIDDQQYYGIYNLVAPQSIRQKTFASAYADSLNRPALLPTPKWTLKALFGEMSTLLTEGPNVIPQKLIDKGFDFQYSNINEALEAVENNQ